MTLAHSEFQKRQADAELCSRDTRDTRDTGDTGDTKTGGLFLTPSSSSSVRRSLGGLEPATWTCGTWTCAAGRCALSCGCRLRLLCRLTEEEGGGTV